MAVNAYQMEIALVQIHFIFHRFYVMLFDFVGMVLSTTVSYSITLWKKKEKKKSQIKQQNRSRFSWFRCYF